MINTNTTNLSFDELKDQVFNEIIKRKEKLGLIRTKKEREIELERLKNLIDGEIALGPNNQSGKTDIFGINDDFEKTYIDLLLQFKHMDTVFTLLVRHKELNNSIISNLKTNIATLSDKVNKLKDTSMALSDDIIYVENFRAPDSISRDSSIYTDDAGNPIDYSFASEYDDITEAIRIPKLVAINKLIASNGQQMAMVQINKQIGSGLINIKNPNNSIDKAIDTDRTTYWEETILADEPINVELDTIKYHKHKFGALCEIEIIFNSMVEFNEIKLTPFGSYPMDVISIKKYTTDTPDREEDSIIEKYGDLSSIEIVSPTHINDYSRSKVIDESVLYQFESVIAKRIRIVLNQKHYIKNSFIYDKNQYEKNELWFASSDKVEVPLKAHQQGIYTVKAMLEKQWVVFTNMLKKIKILSKIDIEELLFPKTVKLTPTTKYEYNYGLYNVSINENNFKNMGVYISNSISIGKNIGAIDLKVDEFKTENHEIHYFVSFVDKPTGSDWVQIIPGATLNIIDMLNNGSISYGTQKERFFGTRGKSIKLGHSPFVYYNTPSSAYISVNITTADGIYLSDGVEVINVTNYSNPSDSYKNFSDTGIQYYFYENKVYFNKTISKDTIIDIDYRSFIDNVRLKAVLKRVNNSSNSITPMLKGYTLTFKPVK